MEIVKKQQKKSFAENLAKEKTDRRLSLFGIPEEERLYSKNRKNGKEDSEQCRLLLRNGHYNIQFEKISNNRIFCMKDIYSTFVELSWTFVALIYSFAFIISWIGFAGIWFVISYLRNDFDEQNLTDSSYERCVQNGVNFPAMILFSLETQTTIGYGFRYATTSCPEGIVLLMLQTCFGSAIHVFMTGFIFAKLTRPKKRAASILFSKNVVVSKRDDKLMMLFRIADSIHSHMITCSVSAVLIKKRTTKEGEVLNLEQYNVPFGLEDGKSENLLLAWPITICHVIDESSPFFELSKDRFKKSHFELIIILAGTNQFTSQTVQAHHSYIPSEILWGHRFARMIFYQKSKVKYRLNCSTFNDVVPIENFSDNIDFDENEKEEDKLDSSDSETEFENKNFSVNCDSFP